jgi:hypothetical protein
MRNVAGSPARRSKTSSPVRWSRPEQQGQIVLSTSTSVSRAAGAKARHPVSFAGAPRAPPLRPARSPRNLGPRLRPARLVEEKLILGNALGPAPEAVTLHRPDIWRMRSFSAHSSAKIACRVLTGAKQAGPRSRFDHTGLWYHPTRRHQRSLVERDRRRECTGPV